jgi:hypothetical protein
MTCSRTGYRQWCDETAMDEDRSGRGGLSIAWTCCDLAADRDGGKQIQNLTTTTELLVRMRSPAGARMHLDLDGTHATGLGHEGALRLDAEKRAHAIDTAC